MANLLTETSTPGRPRTFSFSAFLGIAGIATIVALPLRADHQFYATGLVYKNYVVGARLPPSGLFEKTGGGWQNVGFRHPNIHSLDYDPRNPEVFYLAAGNGCLKSADRGRTWAQTTGWEITEPQSVSVDPNAPDEIYLALPDGVLVSRDAAKSWRRSQEGLGRTYVQWIRADRTQRGRVLAATEKGIFLSEDGAANWRRVADSGMTAHLAQSPHDPKTWLAATQTQGLWKSADNGATWNRVYASKHPIYNLSFDPTKPGRVAIGGWGVGVMVSEDGGATFASNDAALPSKKVWRVAFDPDHSGRLYASVHEAAIYQGEAGAWKPTGFDGSMVWDFVFVPAATSPFQRRLDTILDSHNAVPVEKAGHGTLAARLHQHQDVEAVSRRVIELLEDPTGDMFWMFPVTAVVFTDQGQLSAEARAALRRAWRTYMPYRGDTENHWLLYYSCLYLMTQMYPGDEEVWFNGKSSLENRKEAEEWILHWMDLTTTIGQGEYDCTHYLGVYMLPLSYLHAWSKDEKMRKRAQILLEWITADFAVETLNGMYAGSHARTNDQQLVEKWNGVSSDFAWLFFGEGHRLPGAAGYVLYYALASGYQPPAVIQRIATDRSQPYMHYERKRTRHRWRYSELRNAPVWKRMYMRKEYAVGSDQGGLLQPVQQHSWDVTWAVDDPRGVHNTIFSAQPYSSPFELQMYFPVPPDWFTEDVVKSKPTFDSPDKLLGGSPYESIFQDRDTVIALYDIDAATKFPHVNGFFSKDLRDIDEHSSGWIFARGGDAFLAYRPLAPYEWAPLHPIYGSEGKRLYSPHLKNGTIIQAAASSEFPSFAAFKQAMAALPLTVTMEPKPRVKMRSLRGAEIDFTFGDPPKESKLFEGPFLNADVGARRMVITHGAERRVLDLGRLAIED